jgi:thiazole/oxazole-forming peptide maturase SagD family component
LTVFSLTLGTRLVATAEGVIALLPRSRSLRIQLGSREFERDLIRTLGAARDASVLTPKYSRRSVDDALLALETNGLIHRVKSTLVLDLHEHPDASAATLLGDKLLTFDSVSISTPLGAPAFEELLGILRERGISVRAAWTAGTTVVVGADDGRTAPCLRCALRFDTQLRDVTPGVLEGKRIEVEVRSGAVQLANALLAMMSQPGAAIPNPGRAHVVDALDLTSRWETYPRHPSCSCEPVRTDSQPVCESWEAAEPRRFTPLICLERSDSSRPARVLFRRTPSLRTVSAADYGIASAAGPKADLRAFAEGVERYCMLHCPPDVRSTSATELTNAFEERVIRGSLFPPEAYGRAGFRHPRFEMGLQMDWSWASPMRDDSVARRLVPTSMIGSPSAGGTRLVDTTSNGYAAHTHRETAIALAALEVIERDAILLWWHGLGTVQRIEDGWLPPAWRASTVGFLATRDVDLPVVMLTTRLPSGGCRMTSAAATNFDAAWAKAVSEMEAALWTLEKFGSRPLRESLDSAEARHGPSEHLAFFLRPQNAERLFDRVSQAPTISARELQDRWSGNGENLPPIASALAAAGLTGWFVDRSLPMLFGPWTVARVFIPDALEVAWGAAYPRLNSPRLLRALAGRAPELFPHPIA